MADIFISYAREDRETAQTLSHVLENRGWSVWWDRRIPTGRRFDDVIEEQLADARCVIALWSAAGAASHWVRDEAADARDRGILTPALLDAVRVPLGFRGLQAADLAGWQGDGTHSGFVQLVGDIERLLGAPLLPPPQGADSAATAEPPKASRSATCVLEKNSRARDLPDLSVFRDLDEAWCPEMVVVPDGAFTMGALEHEGDSEARYRQRPQHRVTIAYRFAVGRYPLTVAEYSRFVEATNREHAGGIYCQAKDETKSWRDPGFDQTDRHPVVGVNWHDAIAYVDWLANETSKPYRLLTEAEWEYACRSGTQTRYSFGDSSVGNETVKKHANFNENMGKTTEVGTYPANLWGIYDMHGNVWEWVEDIWHENYEGSPADGSAWTTAGDIRSRVARGGGWYNNMWCLRPADRFPGLAEVREYCLGFRVARTID